MGAQQNGTFYSNAIKDLDEVAQSTGRTLVTGKRKDVRAELKRRRDEYLKRRLEQRDERVEMQMRKWQALFAEMLIQWDVHVPTLAEYNKLLAQDGKKGEKENMTRTVYNAIVIGWNYAQYKCTFSCKNSRTRCSAGCKKALITGFAEGGHMREHVRMLLKLVDEGKIKRPPSPDIPERPLRPHGNATLGELTARAHKNTEARAARYATYMLEAKLDPNKYSRVVPLPNHGVMDQRLIGRKVEMAWQMHAAKGQELEFPDGYIHCFEGTIEEVVEQNEDATVRSVHKVRTKWAVARIKWDDEFGEADSWHPLNPDLYEKQDGDKPKHQGWHLLNEQYVRFVQKHQ
jgi:hypothetical protein